VIRTSSDRCAASAEDRNWLREVLGREPHPLLWIVRRCRAGHPQVVQTYPLVTVGVEREPFPTLFWLTCARLRRRVAELERQGVILRLEARLAQPREQAALAADHRRYARERWGSLTPADRRFARSRGFLRALRDSGIGGTLHPGIKCLHGHVAHHLARGSTVGRWVEDLVALEDCPSVDR
jgi:hypothetical protein